MLPTRKSVPRLAGNRTTRRPPDHCKETQTAVVWSCLPFIRSGQNHLARHIGGGEEDKADRGRGGKTTSGNGQAWNSPNPRGQRRTGKNGENWLWNHLWCPNDPHGYRIDDDDQMSFGAFALLLFSPKTKLTFFVRCSQQSVTEPSKWWRQSLTQVKMEEDKLKCDVTEPWTVPVTVTDKK